MFLSSNWPYATQEEFYTSTSFTSHPDPDDLILAKGCRQVRAAIVSSTCCLDVKSFKLESGVAAAAAAALVVVRGAGRQVVEAKWRHL